MAAPSGTAPTSGRGRGSCTTVTSRAGEGAGGRARPGAAGAVRDREGAAWRVVSTRVGGIRAVSSVRVAPEALGGQRVAVHGEGPRGQAEFRGAPAAPCGIEPRF